MASIISVIRIDFLTGKVINRNSLLLRSVATILVRYGETGLKGPPVRRRFEALLVENILRAHSQANLSCVVERQRGRLFISSEEPKATADILSRTFGIVSLSLAEECSSDIDEISDCSVKAMRRLLKGGTFAIRARRTGSHPYTSMKLAAHVGEKVLEAFPESSIKVDLSSPDVELFIEVRNNNAYIFDKIIQGPGGLPLRSQGKVLSVIEDGKSLLSSWLIMRRGCSMVFLNKSELKAKDIELLRPWNPWWNGMIEDADIDEILKLKRCAGLVLGWTLDEFEMNKTPRPGVPVFYPLVGMTSDEIDQRMKALFA